MTQHEVSFMVTPAERKIIKRIADRGWGIEWLRKSYADYSGLLMDVTAVHANGNPLRLQDLLDADDFNFAHDMSGICSCLDRNTGKLTRGFRPRFSQPKSEAA